MGKHFMGIDPSTVSTGYAVIDEQGRLIAYGVINPDKELAHHTRLGQQHQALDELIRTYEPVLISCEEQFSRVNIDTLKKITRTSAVPMVLAALHGIDLDMMYPSEWRKIYHGIGNVVKKDTLKLVNETHELKLRVKDNDIADAIGIAHAGLLKWSGLAEQPKQKAKAKRTKAKKRTGGLSDEDIS